MRDERFIEGRSRNSLAQTAHTAAALGLAAFAEAVRRILLLVIWVPARLALLGGVILTPVQIYTTYELWHRNQPLHSIYAALSIPVIWIVAGAVIHLEAMIRAGRLI